MKTKLFTLLTMLVLCVGSMWSDDITVTISDKTDLNSITDKSKSEAATVHKYGTYSGSDSATPPHYTTFTTNDDSGLKDVIISSEANIFKPTYYSGDKYKHCFAIYPASGSSDAQTITITAPTGYYIKGYSMTYITTGNAGHFTITPLGGSATTTANPGSSGAPQTKTVSSLNANTATFTIARTEDTKSATTEFCLSRFTVTLAAVPTYDNVTYKSCSILYSTGTFSRTDGKSSVNSNDTWESSTLSGLKYTCNRNSMGKATVSSTDYTCFHSGYSPTYTITAPDGYLIAGYSMSVFGDTDQYLQSTDYGKVALSTNSSSPTSIYVTGINAKTASMQRSGKSNGWGYITSFSVYLIPLVTYTIVDGTATVFGGSVIQSNGSAPNLSNSKSVYKSSAVSEYPSYANGYCTYSYYSDEDCTTPISTITVTAETGPCTVYAKVVSTEDPVEFASSVDDVDAQWYTLKLRDYQFYVDGETVKLSSTDITSASAQWVFTGSICNAYVYNKSAEKYLVMSNGACALSDTPQPWIIYPHQVEGFYLYYASDYKFPFRDSNGNIDYSTGPFNESANAASFVPTEIKTNYKEDVIANVQPFFTTGVGSYFGLKTTVKETYEDDVTAATTACDAEEYSGLLAVVSNPSNFVYPTSGYYRIQNYSTEAYLGKTGSAPTIEFANTDAASVLYLTRSGDEGSYKYTINMQGANYRNTGKSGTTGNYSLDIVAPGRFTMNDCNNAVFGYLYASGTTLSQDDIKGNASYWTLEDATSFSAAITNANDNTGTGHSYATLCVPFAISSITGASAYAPSIDENSLDLGDALSTPITAGTPIMLVGATDAGTYTANIKTDATPVSSPAGTNALTGTFTGISIDCTEATGTNYILGFDRNNDNRIGFYHVSSSSYNLKANRAYLNLGAGGDARGFYINFDDVVTGISSMDDGRWTMDGESVDIYNLSGQRLNKMQKGINIVNGKKVLF